MYLDSEERLKFALKMGRPVSPERRHENQLIDKATRELFTVTDLIEKLRNLCLQRGVEGELMNFFEIRLFQFDSIEF